jgi:hypothetical protein
MVAASKGSKVFFLIPPNLSGISRYWETISMAAKGTNLFSQAFFFFFSDLALLHIPNNYPKNRVHES